MFTFERDREEIIRLIRDHGLTPTTQRIEIGQVLLNKPQHLCADEVLKKVKRLSDKVSKATVYNTLKSFLQHGLVQEVKISNQQVIYDSVTESHHHFYNEDSGELSDIAENEISIQGLPRLPNGLESRGVDVLIRVGNINQTNVD